MEKVKKILSVGLSITIAVLLFAAVPISASNQNLIPNGDLETLESGVPTGLSLNGVSFANGYATVNTDSAYAKSGTNSVKVDMSLNNTTTSYMGMQVNVEAGKWYRGSAYFMVTEDFVGSTGVRMAARSKTTGASSEIICSNGTTIIYSMYSNAAGNLPKNKWNAIEYNFKATETASIWVVMQVEPSTSGVFYVDDFSLREMTENFVVNNGFESLSAPNQPFGWILQGTKAAFGTNVIVDEACEGANGNCLKLAPAAGDSNQVRLVVNADLSVMPYLTVGQTYKISFRFRASTTTANGWFRGYYYKNGVSLTNTYATGDTYFKAAQALQWQNAEYYFTVPTEAVAIEKMTVMLSNSTAGTTMWFDDLSIVPYKTSISFLSEGGSKVQSFTKGNKISANCDYVPVSTTGESADFVFALYTLLGNEKKLNSIQVVSGRDMVKPTVTKYTGVATAPGNQLTTSLVEVPNDSETYAIEAFLWKDLSSLSPINAKSTLPSI